jgi:hypothetical protein
MAEPTKAVTTGTTAWWASAATYPPSFPGRRRRDPRIKNRA